MLTLLLLAGVKIFGKKSRLQSGPEWPQRVPNDAADSHASLKIFAFRSIFACVYKMKI